MRSLRVLGFYLLFYLCCFASALLAEEPRELPQPGTILPLLEDNRPLAVSIAEQPQLRELVPLELQRWFDEGSFRFLGARVADSAPVEATELSGADLLGRAQLALERFPHAEYQIALHERQDRKPERARDLRFASSRIQVAGSQQRRELVEFSDPLFLSGYRWLTYRFPGSEEDLLWVSSPAIGKLRELSSTNRSDYLLGLQLSLNDLLLTSEKQENWRFKQPEQTTRFTPISIVPEISAVRGMDSCLELATGPATAPMWNYDSPGTIDGPGWLPSATVFVPRTLWRVEADAQDPFGVAAGMTIYFDSASGLPVYKFLRNRDGALRSAVFGSFGKAREPDSETALVRPIWTLVVSSAGDRGTLISYERVRYCEKVGEQVLARFDPKALVPATVATPATTNRPLQSLSP